MKMVTIQVSSSPVATRPFMCKLRALPLQAAKPATYTKLLRTAVGSLLAGRLTVGKRAWEALTRSGSFVGGLDWCREESRREDLNSYEDSSKPGKV